MLDSSGGGRPIQIHRRFLLVVFIVVLLLIGSLLIHNLVVVLAFLLLLLSLLLRLDNSINYGADYDKSDEADEEPGSTLGVLASTGGSSASGGAVGT